MLVTCLLYRFRSYLYLGGTIGMKVIRKAYEPVSNYLPNALREMSVLHNAHFAERMKEVDPNNLFLYLPLSSSLQ